jgi:hypoxanthine phosphoribosyltransferase
MKYAPLIINSADRYPLDSFTIPQHYEKYLDSILIPKGMIKDRIERLARDIHRDYHGKELVLLCVLKGGEKFFSDITHYLDILNSNDKMRGVPFKHDFLRASSYTDDKSTGKVKLTVGDLESLVGKNVLLVEDIIDTGRTIKSIVHELKKYSPRSVRVASLLIKRTRKGLMYNPSYVGFSIPNKFVVGYCLDYNEHYRDLSHICIINDSGKKRFKKKTSPK